MLPGPPLPGCSLVLSISCGPSYFRRLYTLGSPQHCSFNKLLVYLTFVDLLLIVACVNEFAVLNVFVGAQPYWYRLTFPYFIHPLKVR